MTSHSAPSHMASLRTGPTKINREMVGRTGVPLSWILIIESKTQLNSLPLIFTSSQKAENHRLNSYPIPWGCASLGSQNQPFTDWLCSRWAKGDMFQ